jgi:hypothetical protein
VAIALGLVALRGNNWVMGIPDGFAPVKVRFTDVPVEHEVKMKDFKQWLERTKRGSLILSALGHPN